MEDVSRKGNVMTMSYSPKRGCEVISCCYPTVLGEMPKSDQEVKPLKISATLHHVGQRLPEPIPGNSTGCMFLTPPV